MSDRENAGSKNDSDSGEVDDDEGEENREAEEDCPRISTAILSMRARDSASCITLLGTRPVGSTEAPREVLVRTGMMVPRPRTIRCRTQPSSKQVMLAASSGGRSLPRG